MIEVERFICLDVSRHHAKHEVPLAHRRVAVEHFGSLTNRLRERRDGIATLAREFDVGEDGDVEAKCGAVEQGEQRVRLWITQNLDVFFREPRDADQDLGNAGGVDALMLEFSLESREGIALMCLAEALLRVPDAETMDALIEDKIAPSNWGKHLGKSASSLVNASTWALMLTGKVLEEREPGGRQQEAGGDAEDEGNDLALGQRQRD